jgi:MoaA/NifB/PqqE/SkfB family radical SAM enzyme
MDRNTPEGNFRGQNRESLSIEVTNRCNRACSHCFVRAANSQYADLPVDLVRKMISEGYRLGYRHLHITGGEPLLWKGLFEAMDYAYDCGYNKVFLNTNGTLFTDDVIRRLSDYEDFSISISWDGPESAHDNLRGIGSYGETERAIEKALTAGINLCIFTTVSKSLLPMLPRFIDGSYERFPDIGCFYAIQLIRVKDDMRNLSNELLDPEDFVRLVRMVCLLNFYGHKTAILNNPLAVVVSNLSEMPLVPKALPLVRDGHLMIMANRRIALAHSEFEGLERYEPGMIEKVLSSQSYHLAIAPDETTCPLCEYNNFCRGYGMTRPSEWFRCKNSEIPFCKRVLEKAVSEKRTRICDVNVG